MSRSLHQRWRERPRCPASPLAPAHGDGVVHAIVGCAGCRCMCGPSVRDGRAARARVFVPRIGDAPGAENRESGLLRYQRLTTGTLPTRAQDLLPHHRAIDAGAVLGVVNALRFASTRPMAGPSGIDDASARQAEGHCAMVGQNDAGRTMLTCASCGRMLTLSHQCRTALPPFAATAYGARFRPAPSGHFIERYPCHIAARCTAATDRLSARRYAANRVTSSMGIALRAMPLTRMRSPAA